MFGSKILKLTSIITLCVFMFFVFTAETGFAQSKEDDVLMKAKRLYQEGDYEASINLLSQFIEKLKAMVEQKKNVAEAFYLLAKIYFEVGDDKKVEENLHKVFVTYPTFSKDEPNFSFKERVEKIRGTMNVETEKFTDETTTEPQTEVKPQPRRTNRVIEQSYAKKKKKFPILLVVGGVVVVAAVAVLLLKKKKDSYDIRGDWTVNSNFAGETFRDYFTFSGSKTSGSFVDGAGIRGSYTVNGSSAHFAYTDLAISLDGTFSSQDNMSGTAVAFGVSGTWNAVRGFPATMSASQASLKAKMK